ncbi:MvdC/MvdD family ATP grasp protein [Pararobbsia silviterrae]|uniref:Alpha-L-glutamate ligase n=1 Tax=Pararobbsia silviterrae TaxID=1792498 RepID=A0A494XM98_9BURK|nr:alpha-L-glutamate ligase [Pararobbsia silviterrae]RKP48663.1 alpha-L-glutamate ligase [Pararobbsia silviterrae]
MKILIVSSLDDPHALAVMRALAGMRGVDTALLDLSAFSQRLSVSMDFRGGARTYGLHHADGHVSDLGEIGAIWWRRPQPFALSAAMTDPHYRQFAMSEAQTAFRGLWQSLDAFWINAPSKDAIASDKPWQLKLAQQAGLEIPATLITSDPDAARAFWREHDGNVIYKQFLALPQTWRETRRLTQADMAFADTVRETPVIFQRFVEADADIRAIVVGDAIFAAGTDVRAAAYPTDVRMNLDTRYTACSLPPAVHAALLALMREMGLEYGAIDLRRTPDGRYVFLEINPAGQFLYIEMMTGLPISAALAAHLASGSRAA